MRTILSTALALVALAATGTAHADSIVLQIPADQVVNIDTYAATVANTGERITMSQVQISGAFESSVERIDMMSWLSEWAHGGDRTYAVVELLDENNNVVRRLDLENAVPYRYVPSATTRNEVDIAQEAFFFSGELVHDIDMVALHKARTAPERTAEVVEVTTERRWFR